jgi:hypothetical protein
VIEPTVFQKIHIERKSMMRNLLTIIGMSALALVATGCSSGDQNATNATGSTNTSNVEEMGPEGGSNVTTTPPGNAANAPVGSADNGNVTPGDIAPGNTQGGNTTSPLSGR